MADRTAIEWTDASWNPILARNKATGKVGWHCEHVSEGCRNCYAERLNKPRGTGLDFKPGHRGDLELFLDEKMLTQPLRWKRPRMVFVCSMTDLFAEFVPEEWIDKIFAVMALAQQHTFQVLTKRPERMRDHLAPSRANIVGPQAWRMTLEEGVRHPRWAVGAGIIRTVVPHLTVWRLPNVWPGVSVEDQPTADVRIPILEGTPAAVRWISAEPMLEPINILPWVNRLDRDAAGLADDPLAATLLGGTMLEADHYQEASAPTVRGLDWVVAGGESGPGARPMDPDWARSLRDQCQAAGVPFLFKQWGEWIDADSWLDQLEAGPTKILSHGKPWRPARPLNYSDAATLADICNVGLTDRRSTGRTYLRVGKKRAGRALAGRIHDAWPETAA